MTQRERVLYHMKEIGSISAMDAMQEYGIFRLAAVIYDLKKSGYNISKTMEIGENRYGCPIRYATYSLDKS